MERSGNLPRLDSTRASARRRGRALLGLGALLLLQAVPVREALATPPPPTAWKQDGFSGSHRSYNSHETTITAANVATLVERWRNPDVGAINAPQVANGRLFVTTGADAVALATEDGHELWRVSPTEVDECGLYEHVLTPDGKLTVSLGCIFGGGTVELDVATGASSAPGFTFHTGNQNYVVRGDDTFWLTYSYGSGGPLAVQLVGYPGLVYFGGLDTLYLSGPTVLGDQLFVGINAAIQAFDLNACPNPIPVFNACGTQWAKTLPGRATTPVGFRGDQIAVASIDGTLGVYDTATGDLLWTGQAPSGVATRPPSRAGASSCPPGAASSTSSTPPAAARRRARRSAASSSAARPPRSRWSPATSSMRAPGTATCWRSTPAAPRGPARRCGASTSAAARSSADPWWSTGWCSPAPPTARSSPTDYPRCSRAA